MHIPGTWSHALAVALLILIALSSLAVAVEKPLRRRMAKRRLRKLRLVGYRHLDPWGSAIVRKRTYFITNWSAAIGRAYRS